MSNKKTDWKSKYYELRSKHINAIDISFRLGFQEGLKTAELQNMQTQLQQAQQIAAASMAQGMPAEGMPAEGMSAEGMPAEGMPAEGMPAEGMPAEGMPAEGMPAEGMPAEEGSEEETDLDSTIQELEKYVSKNEKINFSDMLKKMHKSSTLKKDASEFSDKHKKINDMIQKWDEQK